MPRRGENKYKRRDGRWEGRVLIDSKYHSVYARSYSEVKQKLRSFSVKPMNDKQTDQPHRNLPGKSLLQLVLSRRLSRSSTAFPIPSLQSRRRLQNPHLNLLKSTFRVLLSVLQ